MIQTKIFLSALAMIIGQVDQPAPPEYQELIDSGQMSWSWGDNTAGGCQGYPIPPKGPPYCDESKPGCGCCSWGTGLGATTNPFITYETLQEDLLFSTTVLLEGQEFWYVNIQGWVSICGGLCDGCEGHSFLYLSPDGQDYPPIPFTAGIPLEQEGKFPMSCETKLVPLLILHGPFIANTEDGNSFYCHSLESPCCANQAQVCSEGLARWGPGGATTGWSVLVVDPDINDDGVVNVQDLSLCITHWTEDGPETIGDCQCDQKVDVSDLTSIILNWGATMP